MAKFYLLHNVVVYFCEECFEYNVLIYDFQCTFTSFHYFTRVLNGILLLFNNKFFKFKDNFTSYVKGFKVPDTHITKLSHSCSESGKIK